MSKQTNNLVSKTSTTSATTSAQTRWGMKNAKPQAAFEALEGRQLFSALVVNGTGLDDVIRITQTGPVISVDVNATHHVYAGHPLHRGRGQRPGRQRPRARHRRSPSSR